MFVRFSIGVVREVKSPSALPVVHRAPQANPPSQRQITSRNVEPKMLENAGVFPDIGLELSIRIDE